MNAAPMASPHDGDRSSRLALMRKWLFPDSIDQPTEIGDKQDHEGTGH